MIIKGRPNVLCSDSLMIGYDTYGIVFDSGEFIHRIVKDSYVDDADDLYQNFIVNGFVQIGFVGTRWDRSIKTFSHDKHIISYPYEWTADQLKDALLFHLNLFIQLDQFGLTLKDALPSNILYNSTNPVFVDFLSLIKKEKIANEEWLTLGSKSVLDKRMLVLEKMLFPFFLIPLLAIKNKQYATARKLLLHKACNMGNGQPQIGDLSTFKYFLKKDYLLHPRKFFKTWLSLKYDCNYVKKNFYVDKVTLEFVPFVKSLREYVKQLDVSPPLGPYANYYLNKQESFDIANQEGWGAKQKNILKILSSRHPQSVLDIGANTGWFSRLAEKLGAKVIALDIEEDCVNELYLDAKKNNLNILSLLVPFDSLERAYFGDEVLEGDWAGRDFKATPLFKAPTSRFQSELVMCLGLIHHLVLGAGRDLSSVIKTLARLANDTLILEFVDLSDPLVVNEPSFFKSLRFFNSTNYNIELARLEGLKYFEHVEILESHPGTRKIMVFQIKKNSLKDY